MASRIIFFLIKDINIFSKTYSVHIYKEVRENGCEFYNGCVTCQYKCGMVHFKRNTWVVEREWRLYLSPFAKDATSFACIEEALGRATRLMEDLKKIAKNSKASKVVLRKQIEIE